MFTSKNHSHVLQQYFFCIHISIISKTQNFIKFPIEICLNNKKMSTIVYFSEVCERGNYSKKKGFYFYSIQKIIQKFAAKKEQFAKKFNSSQNTCLS